MSDKKLGATRQHMIREEQTLLLPGILDEKQATLHEARGWPKYSHKTRFRQTLLLGLGLCLSIVLITYNKTNSQTLKSSLICLTPACVLASADILGSRSPNYANIEPCDDFRTYICEGFDNTHDLRADQSDVSSLSILAERGQALLRHILEMPHPRETTVSKDSSADQRNFMKLHNAYSACMDEHTIKENGDTPLIALISEMKDVFSGNQSEVSLSRTYAFLMSIGLEPLVGFGIQADEKDPDVNVLYLNAPYRIGLPAKEYYENKDTVAKYTHMIQKVAGQFRQNSDLHTWISNASEVQALVDFEIKLAAASPSEEEREDVQKYYNPRGLHETSALLPQLGIESLIEQSNSKFEASKIIVGSPKYLVSVSKILEETDNSTIEAYFTWKIVQSYASAIESNSVLPLKQFNNVLGGRDSDAKPERWRTCLRDIDGSLGWILSKFFIENAFSEEAKKYGDEVILDIKSEFIRKLDASEWMSEAVRKVAIDKVHNIVQKIGYPTASPNIRDSEELEDYYARVNITAKSYFDNVLSVQRDDVIREWEKATNPVDRNEWDMTASTVNAYYNPAGNEIVFPAGIMQSDIFYSPEVPKYLTYGAFGAVSGHELSHAFDSTGRHFDQNGNYTDWWDTKTIAEFKRKAECFVHQYANYTITGPDGKLHHLNGHLTLGENLADAGGLSAAFNAWKRRDAEQPAQHLPGLQEYTKEQVFFLAFGKVWCGKTREAEKLRRLYSDPHSPSAARVMLTVANSGEFRESFGCKQREATCKLW